MQSLWDESALILLYQLSQFGLIWATILNNVFVDQFVLFLILCNYHPEFLVIRGRILLHGFQRDLAARQLIFKMLFLVPPLASFGFELML